MIIAALFLGDVAEKCGREHLSWLKNLSDHRVRSSATATVGHAQTPGETLPRSPSEAFDVYLHQPQGSPGFMAKSSSGGIDDDGCTNTWPRRRRPPSQGWKTFPCNHADGIASMDMFVVPTTLFSTTIWIGARTWFIYSFDKKYPQRTRLHFIRRYHLRTVSVFGTADRTEFE
jgi:hypothetical protein